MPSRGNGRSMADPRVAKTADTGTADTHTGHIRAGDTSTADAAGEGTARTAVPSELDTALDELASSREMLLSWIMAAWIATVCLYLVRTGYSRSVYYFGPGVRWWEEVAVPLLIGVTFIIAPLVGIWSLARWLRQGLQSGDINACDTFGSSTR